MSKYVIKQSLNLRGKVKISGSKNAVLPIMAATLLSSEKICLKNVPELKDVKIMKKLLENLGAEIIWDKGKEELSFKIERIDTTEAEYDLITQLRASFLIAGPLLAREGYVKIPFPGGCAIGTRPIDLHLKGFAAMGAEINQKHGYIELKAEKLIGNKVYLDFPSVGATENIMLAAVLAEGQTIIENPALEPEVIDLANFLNKMGADIIGAGTETIKINGVKRFKEVEYKIIPDRIEAGTYMLAAAITKGDILVENIIIDHLKPIIAKLKETGVYIEEMRDKVRVKTDIRVNAVDIKTMPYPGFPTDMQAEFMSLMSVSDGTSIMVETVFENRYMHASELSKMGADIKIDGRTAVVEGVKKLTGTQVKATDLRAGAGLILAALAAEGVTEISDIYHIERGYYRLEEKMKKLGANIEKVEE